MKNTNYSLTPDDISAIVCAVSVLPSYDFSKTMDEFSPVINIASSTMQKLTSQKQLTEQDIYLIAISIDSAYKALRYEINIEPEALSSLKNHLFTINKLFPIFSPVLS